MMYVMDKPSKWEERELLGAKFFPWANFPLFFPKKDSQF
jgi:hypothetical protein